MTHQLKQSWFKNPANEPEPQPEPMPLWMKLFLIVASVAVVLACGLLGNSDTEEKVNAMKWSQREEFLK